MHKPVSLIIGLGRDVGLACTRRLLEAGHDILAADQRDELIDTVEKDFGEKVATYHGDLTTKLGVKNCLAAADERFGRMDNLVVIPTISPPASLADLDMATLDKEVKITVRASVLALKLFYQGLLAQDEEDIASGIERRRQKATITFILSALSHQAQPGNFLESVSQNAVAGLVRASAVELAADRIRCNAIASLRPRAQETEPWLKQRTPMKRAALADEIAEALHYLVSPEAAIITGQILQLDGGRSLLSGMLD